MENMKRVGFIGLGAMGKWMSQRLLKAGFDLVVYDVVSERREMLGELGAKEAHSAQEVALDTDWLVLMVATPEQAEDALFGDRGAAQSLTPGESVIVTSTIGPRAVCSIADRLEQIDVDVLDAPVSGGTARAKIGELLIMVGGNERVLEVAHPVLESIGAKIEYCGAQVGDGQSVKLVNQLLCGVHLAVAGEALAYAEALGLDPSRACQIVKQGAATSFMLEDRADRMLSVNPTPVESALDIFVKDTHLVLEAAQEHGFQVPLAAAAHELYTEGARQGFGREDDSKVKQVYPLDRSTFVENTKRSSG